MKKRTWAYESLNWTNLSKRQIDIFENIELDFEPLFRTISLLEAELTSNTIGSIFKNAEVLSKDSGQKTTFGQINDISLAVAHQAKNYITKWSGRISSSVPVKEFLQKFKQAKNNIETSVTDGDLKREILNSINWLGETAKLEDYANYQSAILGLMSTLTKFDINSHLKLTSTILKGVVEQIRQDVNAKLAGKSPEDKAFSLNVDDKFASAKSTEKKDPPPLNVNEGLWADLTLKYGEGKLKKAWRAAGSPTDSNAIAKILSRMGMTAEDIKNTMIKSGVSENDADESVKNIQDNGLISEVPFKCGIAAIDDEAAKIYSSQGREAFKKFMTKKAQEIENKINPPAAAPEPNNDQSILKQIEAALSRQDIKTVIALLDKNKITNDVKSYLRNHLTNISDEGKKIILDKIGRNTGHWKVTNKEYDEINEMLIENHLNWSNLGIGFVIRHKTKQHIILV